MFSCVSSSISVSSPYSCAILWFVFPRHLENHIRFVGFKSLRSGIRQDYIFITTSVTANSGRVQPWPGFEPVGSDSVDFIYLVTDLHICLFCVIAVGVCGEISSAVYYNPTVFRDGVLNPVNFIF